MVPDFGRMIAPERLARLLAAGGVGLLTLLFASQMYIWINWWPIRIGWLTALAWALPQVALWFLLAPAVLAASRRWPIEAGRRAARIAGHALASVAFGLAGLLLLDASDRVLDWATLMGAPHLVTRIKYTIIHVHWGTAIYWVLVGADHAVRYYHEIGRREALAARLTSQLTEARLSALRDQLNPHFLFNTLNSIAVLVRHDPAGAEEMLHRLSGFLRGTLEGGEAPLCPLGEELDRVAAYIGIEERRFRDRLTVRWAVAPEARQGLVPSFILQPLVENALRHGLAPREGPGTLTVSAERQDGELRLAVRDDGVGLPAAPEDGVGLQNTRERLATLFGERASLVIRPGTPSGSEAIVRLPWTAAGESA